MIPSLTFIHAADLHLGAPFRGLRALSEKWAARLLDAIPEAYDRMIDAALRHKVDFVVVAGDIFDNAHASYADYLRFFNGLKRLGAAGIPAYLCTGNHDPYTSWRHDFFALPSNTTMFSGEHPSFALFERDGEPLCVLGGRGYYNQTWSVDEDIAEGVTRTAAEEELGARASRAPYGVGVLHTGLDLDPMKAPVDPAELLRAGFDYWALGHIHARRVMPPDNPRIAFSGCIQGRDIKETGERGVNLVTLRQGFPNEVEFIPTASVVWQQVQIDVGECATLSEAADKVTRELFRMNGRARCEEMCTRITLAGATPLHAVLNRPGVLEDMRQSVNDAYPTFFCDALVDATRPPRDLEALRREGLFPSVFLQTADAMEENESEAIDYLQDEFLKRGIHLPGSVAKQVGCLSRDAKDLVLDLLSRGDGS